MPDLPGLPLSQEHFDRIVAVFPGTTAAEKTAAFHAWQVNNLLDLVTAVEFHKAKASIEASLPARPPMPKFY